MRRLAACALAAPLAVLSGCAMSSANRVPAAAQPPYPARSATVTTTAATSSGAAGGYAPPPAAPTRERDPAPVQRPQGQPSVDVEFMPARPGTAVQSVGEDTTVSVQGGVDGDRSRMQEARIGAQVQRIRDEQVRIAANPGVCRDVCFAAGSICLAAQEVCHLAGDADARCARARAACTEAGQQRDGTCPVCPPTH